MKNAEIADAFEELGTLYELDGVVVYRVLAYRNAAKAIRESGVSVAELAKEGRVQELSGVGKTIAEKIDQLLDTGSINATEKLKEKIPVGLVAITAIPGLGPKRVRQLHQELGIESLDDLRTAAEAGQLAGVSGFGAKAEANVLKALEAGADGTPKPRVLLSTALEVGERLVEGLRAHPSAIRIELAGSARRWADSVKDLDIVAASSDAKALVDAFAALPEIDEVSGPGEAGARATTHQGIDIDLRIVPAENFGNLLQHFTGSGRHNEALRTAAVRRGLHVSEHGIKDDESGETFLFETEEEVYEKLGMTYIEPELREERGELEAAREKKLPDLIELADIRGDLHCHTTASDGRNTVLQMARAAQEQGYEYLAITDHSASHGFGNDVSPKELEKQIERVAKANAKLDGFQVLAGSEVNILPDGSLDYEEELLGRLDWVIASAHTSFRMGEEEMTERIVAAMQHPYVDAIGHPTGRLITRREPYAIDMGRVIVAAAESGTFLEINSSPRRRDINDLYARAAVKAGVTIVIDSDSHGAEVLDVMRYGVATARRAWLTAADVANTRPWKELRKLRKGGR